MEPVPVYSVNRLVSDTAADIRRRQKLSSMFGFFQDIAALHADNLGGSVERLRAELNVAWILTRVRVEVDRYPALAQDVIVETWPQAPRALYERDYRIRDAQGNILVRAGSVWVIMNLETREIVREKFLDYHHIELCKERALGRSVGRQKPDTGGELVYEKEIRYSDLDYNVHVNNAKYVDFIMDAIPLDVLGQRTVRAFEIHYNNEIGPGCVLQVRTKSLDDAGNRIYVDGAEKGGGEARVFNAIVELEEG